MGFIRDIEKWEAELLLAEEFREKEFGEYTSNQITKAGENIDYFERGYSTGYVNNEDDTTTTLNLFHALAKNIIPSLYYKNPKIMVFPKRKVDQESAPYAGEIINHYYKEIDADKHNRRIIWDSYILGLGIYKVGYATKFGADIKDDEKKSLTQKVKEALDNQGKPPVRPEVNKEIIAESPYVQWISPFNFLIDPRATNLEDASWVAHVVEKTVEDIKKDKKFKNTGQIQGTDPDRPSDSGVPIPANHIESFKKVKLYEVHYRTDEGYYLLYICKDGSVYKELYHEKSIYDMDEWQFGILDFSGHSHKFFKRSELTKIKNLQDRFTTTIDGVFEQLDSFVPKIYVKETGLSTSAKESLEDGEIGAIVYGNENAGDVVREIAFTQYKADLKAMLEEIINMITIQTGLTKAQLLGIATGETATSETIAQGGQTLRLNDMSNEINRFSTAQSKKLWKIIRQFVDLSTLELITGEAGVDPMTGMVRYSWLPEINPEMDYRLQIGDFRFETEVGSTQKADSALIMKRIEDLLNILARTDVIALMQQQGKKVDLAEILRMLLRQMPEVVKDVGKIIQDVTMGMPGTLTPDQVQGQLAGPGQGGMTRGSQFNQAQAQLGRQPTQPGLQQQAAQQ